MHELGRVDDLIRPWPRPRRAPARTALAASSARQPGSRRHRPSRRRHVWRPPVSAVVRRRRRPAVERAGFRRSGRDTPRVGDVLIIDDAARRRRSIACAAAGNAAARCAPSSASCRAMPADRRQHRSAWPACARDGVGRLARPTRVEAGGERAQAGSTPMPPARDRRLERLARERQHAGAGQRAEQRRGNHAAVASAPAPPCRRRRSAAPRRRAAAVTARGSPTAVAGRRLSPPRRRRGGWRRSTSSDPASPGRASIARPASISSAAMHDVHVAGRGISDEHRRPAVLARGSIST